ncbi:MAG: hypothetical protein HW421_740 [Ignavibacteria bacterium]|nr:hypothetical protein [Ignavibacteria bacterium]
MGSFGQHLGGAAAVGIGCSVASYFLFHTPIEDASAVGLVCIFGGVLPDIDSPVSKPAEFVVGIFSMLLPVFALQSLHYTLMSPSRILLVAFGVFLLARYGIRELIKRFTFHRGMFHSIPMAVIWACGIFLAFRHSPDKLYYLAGVSALLGYLTHLAIDEMFSLVDISGGKFTPKKSLGSALKFFSDSPRSNIAVYSTLLFLLYLCAVQVGYLQPLRIWKDFF